jgi:ATP-binding cassette subfamily F protein 3
MRIELAKMLLQKPSFLLLDEPTNHLDIESILWLEDFLKQYPGTVILISHDQQFLDHVTQRTIEIELGNIQDYKVPYSKYLNERAERKAKLIATYNNQQRDIEEKQRTINRFMAQANKTKMAQSMQKQLDRIQRVELETEDISRMKIRFPDAPRSGECLIDGRSISKSYGSKDVLKEISFQIHRGERVSFVGQNGQGKTTFAEILIGKRKQDKGIVDLGHNVLVGYYAQNQAESLNRDWTLLETMEHHSPAEMRTQLRKILGAFLFSGEDVDKKVSVLSGGERARLALACMLLKPINLLVLDEPTNHLDLISKDVLKQAVLKFNGTLLIVSHDREFLKGLTDKTIEFKDQKLSTHLGDIDYFLEKRKMRNIRQLEMRDQVKTASKKTNSDQSYETRKKLQRKLGNTERKIQSLEKDKKSMESEMSASNFFMSPNAETLIKKHQELEKQLDDLMRVWEEIVDEMQ